VTYLNQRFLRAPHIILTQRSKISSISNKEKTSQKLSNGAPPDSTAVSFAAVRHVSGSFFRNCRRLVCSQPTPPVVGRVQSSGMNS
jgi:hypothetical protein